MPGKGGQWGPWPLPHCPPPGPLRFFVSVIKLEVFYIKLVLST